MKGFIEVTSQGLAEKQLISIQSIIGIRAADTGEGPYAIVTLTSAPYQITAVFPYDLSVGETYEQVKALLEQAA